MHTTCKTIELNYDDADHRVGIAAYAEHIGDYNIIDELMKIEVVGNPIIEMFHNSAELKMKNEALTTELSKLQKAVNGVLEDETGDLDIVLCNLNNIISK